MGKLVLITGGARSGKSALALELAKARGGEKVAFVATCKPTDREMAKRIALHKKARPKSWVTYEIEFGVSEFLERAANQFDCVIIDCLTLLVSNGMLSEKSEQDITREARHIGEAALRGKADIFAVANEVGMGVVPESELGRRFRDLAGKTNQVVAEAADEVYFVVSGIPIKIKG